MIWEQKELIEVNRELIDIMEHIRYFPSETSQTVYELLKVATDIINEGV